MSFAKQTQEKEEGRSTWQGTAPPQQGQYRGYASKSPLDDNQVKPNASF